MLEQLDRVGDDPVAAARQAQHALERRERARRGLRRTARTPQLVQQLGDIVDCERGDPAPAQARQQVALELVAVGLERARVALAGGDLRLEASHQPATVSKRSRGETGTLSFARGRDQRQPLTPSFYEVAADRPEAQPARVAPADRVLAAFGWR